MRKIIEVRLTPDEPIGMWMTWKIAWVLYDDGVLEFR